MTNELSKMCIQGKAVVMGSGSDEHIYREVEARKREQAAGWRSCKW
jgi:hypothetical protein